MKYHSPKPKKKTEEDVDEAEDWLISYADMMTLIACFFILMTAFANYDPVGFTEKAVELAKSFRRDKFQSLESDLKVTKEEISKHPELEKLTKLSIKDSELIVTFSGSTLFKNLSADLDEQTILSVDSMADIIKTTIPQGRILIEGHADDYTKGNDPADNWSISFQRAVKVLKRFELAGFQKDNIVAIAKGDANKLFESFDNRKKEILPNVKFNRRVVIRVLEPKEKKRLKLGLGVYFKDASKEVNDQEALTRDKKGYKIE